MPPVTELRRAHRERDASYDGLFFVGVRTTGIFCRPTCPARAPRPENVEYLPTSKAALAARYRPCKRCRPLELDDQPPWAGRPLAEIESDPSARITDAELRERCIDPGMVRRYFVRRYGMTFQAFTRARRLSLALGRIRENQPVDGAVFESGYGSHGGFRDAFIRTFGKTPGKCRNEERILVAWLRSPIGPLVAGATGDGICLLEFADRRSLETEFTAIQKRLGLSIVPGSNEHLKKLEAELADYFAGSLKSFSLPLVCPGTPFQRQVWEQLRAIPYGQTRSYEEMAAAVGRPKAVRALGSANGSNRMAIVVPCHRVVNKNGGLGGYGGGLWRKQYLLDLEKSAETG